MMRLIDNALNTITMYRLTLYFLIALLGLAVVESLFGLIPGGPLAIVATTAVLLAVCFLVNAAIARIMKIRSNPESSLITALILALISGPVSLTGDPRHIVALVLAGVVAIASKYLLALRKQHLFNPAAVGALFSGLVFGDYASWWVGNLALLPLVVVGGFLLVRRISRLRLIGVFLLAFSVFMVCLGAAQGLGPDLILQSLAFVFAHSSLLFFAAVMFTEPMTSPKRFPWQVAYALVVALLYQPQLQLFGGNLTPEEALLIGNLLSFIVSPSYKLRLALKERTTVARETLAFTFPKPPGFTHRVGQFMEWTLPVAKGDGRGERRYFSIASSPTEKDILVAARFSPNPSQYKRAMAAMTPGSTITAGELGGDFTLPKNPALPLAFIAGGIGITPFRSMIKYLVDTDQRRDVVLLYSNNAEDEIAFGDLFDEARHKIGLKAIYTLTDTSRICQGWCGERGLIDADMIRRGVPGIGSRLFFISGPPAMVNAMKGTLRSLGVPRGRIRSDYFPGYQS